MMAELDDVKKLLGISGDDKDVQINFAIEDAKATILNYCNIELIPAALSSTVVRMAVDIYRNESFGEETPSGRVNSLSEGDTSISYGSQYDDTYKGSIMNDYRRILNRYRRVVF